MAKRISVINFKGGVGKTTLAYHLATGLVRFHGATVLLVDVDHQSSLSDLCLGSERWNTVAKAGNTISKVFLPFVSETQEMPGREIITLNPVHDLIVGEDGDDDDDGAYYMLEVVPASLDLDTIEIELTSTHQGNPIRSEWNKRTLICRWIEETRVYSDDGSFIDDRFDYIIFDCPPATQIVSQNAIAASHGYIVPVIPEAVMQRGLAHLKETIEYIDGKTWAYQKLSPREQRKIYVPETKLIGFAVTWVRGGGGGNRIEDHEEHMENLENTWGDVLVKPYIPHTTLVSKALAANIPVYDLPESDIGTWEVSGREIHEHYRDLVTAIKHRIDTNL